MRMLLQKKARIFPESTAVAPPKESNQDCFQAGESGQQTSASELGTAQERIATNLAEISRLAEHMTFLEPLIAELRGPLEAELLARRRDHAELGTLRALLAQTNERLGAAEKTQQSLRKALAASQAVAEDLESTRRVNERVIDQASQQVDSLCNALQAAESKISTTEERLRENTISAMQLQEDLDVLRRQMCEEAESRCELDNLIGKTTQELLLSQEEALSLRRRVDQATGDAARFARAEADAQAQLAHERGRIAPMQAALNSARNEILNLTKRLEEQSDAACAGIAALHTRLETATARSARLEALNAEQCSKLSEASAQQRNAIRRATEDSIAIDRSKERIKILEAEAVQHRAVTIALERARGAAVDRADELSKLCSSQEILLRSSEERAREAQAKLEASVAEAELTRLNTEQRLADAVAEIERVKTELAMAEANLESARSERAKSHVALLRNCRPMEGDAPSQLGSSPT